LEKTTVTIESPPGGTTGDEMILPRLFGNGQFARWARGILTAMLLAVLSFMLVTQIVLMGDMREIMASRWTTQDQAGYSTTVWAAINEKADNVDVITAPEVKLRLDRIEQDVIEIKGDVKALVRERSK
jgi:hypothetical protein